MAIRTKFSSVMYRPCDNEQKTFKNQRAADLYRRLHTKTCEYCKTHTNVNQSVLVQDIYQTPQQKQINWDTFIKAQEEGLQLDGYKR